MRMKMISRQIIRYKKKKKKKKKKKEKTTTTLSDCGGFCACRVSMS